MRHFNENDFTEIRDIALKAINCSTDEERENYLAELARSTGHDINTKDQAIGFVSAINLLLFTSEEIEKTEERHRNIYGGPRICQW